MDWRKKRLALGELLIFSGHKREDAPLTQGVALMLSKTAQRAFIGWEAHGPRFLVANCRTNKRKSNYMSSSTMHQLMKAKRKKKMSTMTAMVQLTPERTHGGFQCQD